MAHREKDLIFVGALIEARLINPTILADRVYDMYNADPGTRATILHYLEQHLAG